MRDSFYDNRITRDMERRFDFWAELERLKSDPDYQEPTCVIARSLEEGKALAAYIDEFESTNE